MLLFNKLAMSPVYSPSILFVSFFWYLLIIFLTVVAICYSKYSVSITGTMGPFQFPLCKIILLHPTAQLQMSYSASPACQVHQHTSASDQTVRQGFGVLSLALLSTLKGLEDWTFYSLIIIMHEEWGMIMDVMRMLACIVVVWDLPRLSNITVWYGGKEL